MRHFRLKENPTLETSLVPLITSVEIFRVESILLIDFSVVCIHVFIVVLSSPTNFLFLNAAQACWTRITVAGHAYNPNRDSALISNTCSQSKSGFCFDF